MALYKKSIVLVGMMGVGKTRAGELLAAMTGLPFVDSDREIERISHRTVAEIFKQSGESEFRRIEKDVLRGLINGSVKVIAAGGGAFMQEEIRNLIKEKVISAWLKANINVLLERLGNTHTRPLLQDTDPAVKLQQLIDVRYPVYAEADITIVTDGQTPQDTAKNIKSEIDRLLGR
jgi:shikimate kinase